MGLGLDLAIEAVSPESMCCTWVFTEALFTEVHHLSWGSEEKPDHFRMEQERVEGMTEEGLGEAVLLHRSECW